MLSSCKKVFFGNHVFLVLENVYEPAEDSFLFAENIHVRENEIVLDIGTGCGILGIVAADKVSQIVAVDVNPYAVRCAKENAKLNNVSNKMCFFQGDLFTAIRDEEKFDLVLFNAPYLPSEDLAKNWLDYAWSGGVAGRQIIDRFILEVPKHLRSSGRILLMQSTLSSLEETTRKLERNGLRPKLVARRDLPFFETIVLIEAQR
jgi:release factor glutamine methyltransferase